MKYFKFLLIVNVFFYIACSNNNDSDNQDSTYLTIENEEYQLDYKSQSIDAVVKSSSNFSATSNQNWCTITGTSVEEKMLQFTVSENPLNEVRNATITIKNAGITKTITIKQNGTTSNASSVFTDRSISELSSGVTLSQINALTDAKEKEIALALYNNTYVGSNFRIQQYEPYRPIAELKEYLGNQGNYNRLENPSGIRIKANEEVYIYAEGIGTENVRALIVDHGTFDGANRYSLKDEYYFQLKDGKNVITSTIDGNIHIDYYTSAYLTADKPTIHIVSGSVAGYFDPSLPGHDNVFWKELLDKGEYEVLDIKGERVNMIYSKAVLKEKCPNNGVELVAAHDRIVDEQHALMGLVKYNKVPKNHMLAVWNPYGASPVATSQGVFIPTGGSKKWAETWKNPIPDAWGLYHELGHHNEMRAFRWQGTQEVVNNLYSCWNEYLNEAPTKLRYEYTQKEDSGDGLGSVVMGPYQLYLNEVVHAPGVDWNSWIDWKDSDDGNRRQRTRGKVVFIWQLQLYLSEVLGITDAYPDYFEKLRSEAVPTATATKQINYYKYFCDAAQMDLTDHFVTGKMLVPYSSMMGNEQVTITESMTNDAKAYVASKGYPKPESKAIHYISVRTLDVYKNKIPLAIANIGEGISISANVATISADVWTGAVAFEAYNGDTVTNCSIAYTGSSTNDKTLLAFPDEATLIKAVAWDGTRKIIYTQ